jgi:hypothetical protein
MDNSSMSFLLYGGFIYFNAQNQVIAANAIVGFGEGLSFSPPRRWKRQFSPALRRQQRFQEITIDNFREAQFTEFCWLCPGEHIACDNSTEVFKIGDFGGFVYFSPTRGDIYFEVLDPVLTQLMQ